MQMEWEGSEESQARIEVGMELLTPGHKNDGAKVMDLLLMVTIRYHTSVTHETLLVKVLHPQGIKVREGDGN